MKKGPTRTKLQRDADEAHVLLVRRVGQEVRSMRGDVGVSERALARVAGIDESHLHRIETADREPSIQALSRLAAALGGEVSIRIYPGTGPRIRDRVQARMVEALLAILDDRWTRLLEVALERPVRGVIDLVLGDPAADLLIASEFESTIRRLEQQVRWSGEKAAALPNADAVRPARADPAVPPQVSRLLVLRSTIANRELAATFERTLATAYPARAADAYRALTTAHAPWPGPAILWATIDGRSTRIMDAPPRGVTLGR